MLDLFWVFESNEEFEIFGTKHWVSVQTLTYNVIKITKKRRTANKNPNA